MQGICDKCGGLVDEKNDAYELLANLDPASSALRLYAPKFRHILPVRDDDGNIVCEGSPSTAQYLPGQPKDLRMNASFNKVMGKKIRRAYFQMNPEARPRTARVATGVAMIFFSIMRFRR